MNGERIKLNFKKYCEIFINALHEAAGVEEKPVITWEVVNDRWEVAFAASSGNFQQGALKIQNKSGAAVTNAHMRNHFFIFVNCLIENPAFTSQTKEQLTTISKYTGLGQPTANWAKRSGPQHPDKRERGGCRKKE
ncbi:hypothetical protein B9Z19DRAFT_1123076 [Tuber borchii]|uniref:DNA topoisomerase (ATP-hydrolyzing) n=1 Tax=Tuber borchii TaxID=42251 RepID=A0A2T6ZZ14_TUBBO|nr:hypothetical protein B9Z19DRAFT_1123076 [Tuber borchii]